jgi:hypothetical protein
MKLALRIILFAVACLLLAYGSAMMLFVPGTLGHYFDRNLVLYGLVPVVLSAALLGTVGVLWVKQTNASSIATAIAKTISLGVATVWLFYIVMGLVAAGISK